jgi:hypothetical protein
MDVNHLKELKRARSTATRASATPKASDGISIKSVFTDELEGLSSTGGAPTWVLIYYPFARELYWYLGAVTNTGAGCTYDLE